MDTWVSFVIFVLVLFLYVHLQYQYKKSEDLEIYEFDYSNNTELQEICDLKQPVLFQIDMFEETEELQTLLSREIPDKTDVIVRDIRDYYKDHYLSIPSLHLSYSSASGLMNTDPKGHFFSESNSDIPELSKTYKKMDLILSPPFSAFSKYDLLFGSNNAFTPFRYHTESRRFLYVGEGAGIRVKMTPWKSSKYLSPVNDYEDYHFWSRVNLWKDSRETQKVQCLDFIVNPGFVVYIPPYWWFSILFIDSKNRSKVASFSYMSSMNLLANLPNWGYFILQQQNMNKVMVKTVASITQIEERENDDIRENPDVPEFLNSRENIENQNENNIETK
jgi:hypothetical protein